jgi:hypothetical protein
VGRKHESVLRCRQREEPFGDRRLNRRLEQLFGARRRERLDPFRPGMNLDDERNVVPLKWTQMVDVTVELRIAGRLETGREQRCLGFFGVRDEQIHIAEQPERRIGIARCNLRALVQDRRTVVSRADSFQKSGHAQSDYRGGPFELRDVRRYLSALLTPAAGREELEPMTPEVGKRGRPIDETIDCSPKAVTRRLPATHAGNRASGRGLPGQFEGSSRSASPPRRRCEPSCGPRNGAWKP